MAKRRIYEIAKDQGIPSKELLQRLRAAGIDAKAAASSVEEADVLKLLANGKSETAQPAAPETTEKTPAEPKQAETGTDGRKARPTRPAASGGRRRVVIDSQASRRPQGPGGPGGGQQGPGGPGGQRRPQRRRRRRHNFDEPPPELKQETESSPELIKINSGSTVKDVAEYFGVPVPEVIKKLMEMGEMATLTQTLSDEAIEVLANEFDREVEIVHTADELAVSMEFEDSPDDLVERPPVVTIMGHVDHGKTSLLDAIRETEVVSGEAGGITQHIGAYQVHHGDKLITFLDTPGHEAFTAMRARGSKVTDIAVIVVAADDGVKPQTEEAIDHAKAAEVPIVVAVNKIDKPDSQPEQVRSQLAQHGLQPEEWGGETIFVDVSAKAKQNLEDLLDTVLLVAEVAELQANPGTEASGVVIESKLDPGRGSVVTVLVQRGTLRVGDALVAGPHWGRVRAMSDFHGARLKQAGPGDPIEVLGFDGVPEAGEFVFAVENERKARQLATERAARLKSESLARRAHKRVSLEDVFELAKQGQAEALNLVLKADVSGSLEAVEDEIAKLPQDEVAVNVIHRGVGGINESDVMLAAASEGIVLGFNVRPVGEAGVLADREGVEIRSYSVIYKAIEELRAAMSGMLKPEEIEESVGQVEIRQVFRASKVGAIAGSFVTEGKITRGAKVRLVREGAVVYDGEVASLRRFKEDAKEVASGFECGVVLKDFADVKEGDTLEVYETKQIERALA